jgi:hypothetical protein
MKTTERGYDESTGFDRHNTAESSVLEIHNAVEECVTCRDGSQMEDQFAIFL